MPAPPIDPAGDLCTKIAALGPFTLPEDPPVDLVVDENLFTGPPRVVRTETPDQALFVELVPGLRPVPYLGQNKDFHVFQLRVIVRSAPQQWDEADQLSRGVLQAVQQQPPAGYVTCLSQQAGPEHYLEDDEQRHHFRFYVELWWKG